MFLDTKFFFFFMFSFFFFLFGLFNQFKVQSFFNLNYFKKCVSNIFFKVCGKSTFTFQLQQRTRTKRRAVLADKWRLATLSVNFTLVCQKRSRINGWQSVHSVSQWLKPLLDMLWQLFVNKNTDKRINCIRCCFLLQIRNGKI